MEDVVLNPANVTIQDSKTGVIPFETSDEILTQVAHESAMMRMANFETMTKPVKEFYYMSGIGAFWVNELERIQTSKPTWTRAEMRAHKLGVIVPTSRENLRYSVPDFFELVRPQIVSAFHKKIDQASLVGINSPWSRSALSVADAAGNIVQETTNKYNDFVDAMAKLEEHDHEADGCITSKIQLAKYRKTKDDVGNPILIRDAISNGAADQILGMPIAYAPRETFGNKIVEIVGDWSYAFYGVLRPIEYEILTEATLTTIKDEAGNDFNLAERDAVAIRAIMSIGWFIANDDTFAAITSDGTANIAPESATAIAPAAMSAMDIKSELTRLGVEFDEKERKADLKVKLEQELAARRV